MDYQDDVIELQQFNMIIIGIMDMIVLNYGLQLIMD